VFCVSRAAEQCIVESNCDVFYCYSFPVFVYSYFPLLVVTRCLLVSSTSLRVLCSQPVDNVCHVSSCNVLRQWTLDIVLVLGNLVIFNWDLFQGLFFPVMCCCFVAVCILLRHQRALLCVALVFVHFLDKQLTSFSKVFWIIYCVFHCVLVSLFVELLLDIT
jgi:hypothetical protein